MNDRDPVLHQNDPDAAQHALEGDGEHGRHAEPAEPAPPLGDLEGGRHGDRQEADDRAEKPVAMLVEDPAHHLRPGEQEHVVP